MIVIYRLLENKHYLLMHNVGAVRIIEIKMATFTMRMDDVFQKEFRSVCQESGCDMSTVITMVGMKMIRERRIPFEVNADPFYLQANQAHIDRSIKQLETMHGKVHQISDDES